MSAAEQRRRLAYVSLGSNLGDRVAHLELAVQALGALPETERLRCSRIYETEPVGPPPQEPYLNAVVELRTGLSPERLLTALLEIETRAGRRRGPERNQARTLDLDLLIYGDVVRESQGLSLPHPRLAERAFVLEPLSDLAPDLELPQRGVRVAELAARVRDARAVRPYTGPLPRGFSS